MSTRTTSISRKKRKLLGSIGKKSHYGTRMMMDTSDSESEKISMVFEDDIDLASWNPESIPLLRRTVDQARSLGVKRTLSWVTGAQYVQDPLGSDDGLADRKVWHWSRKCKVFVLTMVSIVITILLCFLPEATSNVNLITVEKDVDAIIVVDSNDSNGKDSLLELTLHGPFLRPELTSLASQQLLVKLILDSNLTTLDTWNLGLIPADIDLETLYVTQDLTSKIFNIEQVDLTQQSLSLVFSTNSENPVAFSTQLQLLSRKVNLGVIYGSLILVSLYLCITFELAHRTVVAMLAATLAIAVLATLNERPSLDVIITWVDIETLTLLFSMMVIVSILSETGAFNYLGFLAFKFSKGQVWPLMLALSAITATVSAVLDNVTTILLMTPVVIQLCETINIAAIPVLITVVIFSNIGGAATAIGDPPNVIIASDLELIEGGVTFLNFTLHMLICVILVAIVTWSYLRFALRNITETRQDRELHELKHEIIVWNKTLRGLGNFSKEEAVVKEIISLKIDELKDEYDDKMAEKQSFLNQSISDLPSLTSLEESCQITNMGLLVKSVIVLAITVLMFFLQNIPSLNLSLGWTALLGATTLMILADTADIESIFARVEWATLVFFAALFVLMEALAKMGLLEAIGQLVEDVIFQVPMDYRLTVAILMVLWVSGLASAFIDNIPFTTMMIPVIKRLADNVLLDLPLQPLVWSLALGACLGGNGTLIGASANVVCAGVAEQHGYKFTFIDFFKLGFPVTILGLLVASGYLMVCHVALDWNE